MTNEKNRTTQLSSGWTWTRLDSIAEIVLGQSPASSTYNETGKGLPFYQGKLEFGKIYPIPKKWCSEPKKTAEKGDVLVSVRAPVGPTNVCPEKSCIGRVLAAIRGLGGIETLFILYLLRANENELAAKGTGTTFTAISGEQLRSLKIPLPPLNEQRFIVQKVEELFSFLDAGTESLRKVRMQLKRYRQAILKYAFEGKLTEEWRQTRKEPKGWGYVVLSDIAKVSVGHVGPVSKYYTAHEKGISMLSTANISDNGIVRLDEINYVNREFSEKNKSKRIYPGDIIVARHGDSGSAARIPDGFKEAFCLNVVIVRPEGLVLPRFLEAVFRFRGNRDRLLTKKSGSVQSIVGTTALKQFKVPLPSLPEQNEIVERLEVAISIITATENIVEESLRQSGQLRQSILKAAFEGKLVPQDPADEPAEKLLGRIKSENVGNNKYKIDNQLELSNYVK